MYLRVLHMAINNTSYEGQLQLLCLAFELGNPYVFESLTAVIFWFTKYAIINADIHVLLGKISTVAVLYIQMVLIYSQYTKCYMYV